MTLQSKSTWALTFENFGFLFSQLIVPETDKDKAAPKVLYMRVITPGTQGDDFGVYARAIEEKVSFVLY